MSKTEKINNNKIVDNFLQFYFKNVNEKNWNNLGLVFKSNSILKFDNEEVKNVNNIKYYFLNIFSKIIQFDVSQISFTKCGSKKFNILVTGNILQNNLPNCKFTQFFLLAFNSKKEYWLNTTILHTY